MSTVEDHPVEVVCRAGDGDRISVLAPRDVPLGGPRGMLVRRTLPQRSRSLIGAWCFLDHYGPEPVEASGGMNVPPHPHTGLQTVSWLFSGRVEHRDSAGFHAIVRPGELNLMTAGRGISHSERSTADTEVLHGVQLWIALPDVARFTDKRFEHFAPPVLRGRSWRAQVFLGSLLGQTSPVSTHSPLLGAELVLDPGAELDLSLDAAFEHGVLADQGKVTLSAADQTARVQQAHLAHLSPGTTRLTLTAGEHGARLIVLGGTPFGEQIVMWWNFVGRSHDEIVAFRDRWQREIGADGPEPATDAPDRYGLPDDDPGSPLPAPPLPNARLTPRG